MDIKTLNDLFGELKAALDEGTKANAEKIALLEGQITTMRSEREAAVKATADSRADGSIGYKPTGDPTKDFSWIRFFDGVLDGWRSDRVKKHPEYELTMEATLKAQVAGTDTAGGFLVAPEIFVDQVIPALEPRVVALAAGATMITGLTGSPVEWPRWNNYLDGFWVGEAEDATEDSLEASQLRLEPKGCATLLEVTQRLLRLSGGRVESAITQALGRGLARTLDKAIFKGTGGKQPVGIVSQKGAQTLDASTYTLTGGASHEVTDFLEDMIGKCEDANALFGKPTWFMHPHTRRFFYKIKDADGRPLLFESVAAPTSSVLSRPTTFYGYPFFGTTNLVGNNDDADLLFCDVESILIGQWQGLTVALDTSLGFKKQTTFIRASMEVDVGSRYGESVVSALNLDTAP